jgi:chemotaxis protein methyltransferase CheR
MPICEEDFQFYKTFLDKNSGYHLHPEKCYLLESRLQEVVKCNKLDDITTIRPALQREPYGRLAQDVIEAMTVNETFFFRDQSPFEYFNAEILPELAQNRKGTPIRIWSAACSTGQEPYSISMLMHEAKRSLPMMRYEITATDINSRILARARRGSYSALEINRGLAECYLNKYFTKDGSNWAVKDEIKSPITFRTQNLKSAHPTDGNLYDFVFLRNVLIYFDRQTKVSVISNVSRVMQPGGYLLLGAAEHVPDELPQFQTISKVRGLYKLK